MLLASLLAAALAGFLTSAARAQEGSIPRVVVVDLATSIDTVSERFLERAIDDANEEGAGLILIEIDTPGGQLDATRAMVGAILGSDVPVSVYVAPEGAQAASAGTFISVASAFLAMAPSTNIGAASVVTGSGEDLPDTLDMKITEDTTAFIRSIAEQRGRPVEPLEATVLEAKAYSASEAVELGIADLIAADRSVLLRELDGQALEGASGDVTVVTVGAPINEVGMNVFERILSFIANPNVAFLLLSLGGLAIIVELFNPGLWFPAIFGVAALITGWAGIGFLAFSWAGVALIAFALVLFLAEALAPGFGLFGTAGTVSLILGGLFVVGFFGAPGLPGASVAVNRWILIGVGGFVGLSVLWFGWEARHSHTARAYMSATEKRALIGETARVTDPLAPDGEVWVAGETWSARLVDGRLAEIGETVRVADVEDVRLLVEPFTEPPAAVDRPDHSAASDVDQPMTGADGASVRLRPS